VCRSCPDGGMSGRSTSFGAVAAAYERFRPGYPAELFDTAMRYACRPIRAALDIGAGTGKATRLFAERGVTVTATEPDAAMLAELRKHVPANVITVQIYGRMMQVLPESVDVSADITAHLARRRSQ